MEAMPRMAAPWLAPQATTDMGARPAATAPASKRSWKSRLGRGGSNVWKSLRASPTNSSTLVSPDGADARPRTTT